MHWLIKVKRHNLYLGKPERTMTAFLGEARIFATQQEGKAVLPDLPLIVEYECVNIAMAVQDQVRSFIREYDHSTPGERAAVAAMRVISCHMDMVPEQLGAATRRAIEVLQAFQGMCSRMETKDEAQLHVPATV